MKKNKPTQTASKSTSAKLQKDIRQPSKNSSIPSNHALKNSPTSNPKKLGAKAKAIYAEDSSNAINPDPLAEINILEVAKIAACFGYNSDVGSIKQAYALLQIAHKFKSEALLTKTTIMEVIAKEEHRRDEIRKNTSYKFTRPPRPSNSFLKDGLKKLMPNVEKAKSRRERFMSYLHTASGTPHFGRGLNLNDANSYIESWEKNGLSYNDTNNLKIAFDVWWETYFPNVKSKAGKTKKSKSSKV